MNDQLISYVPRVYRFALRLAGNADDAEDLTQETMLRAWRSRHRLSGSGNARVWLFQITANLWRDQLRRRRRHAKWQKSPRAIVVVAEIRPDVIAQERDEVARAVAAMDELPVKQRQVLYLRACEGLSIDEIAAVLEVTPGSVKSNLSLARKTMRRRFFKEHECHLSGGAQE